MPREKQKVDKTKRLVEADAELVEDAAIPAPAAEVGGDMLAPHASEPSAGETQYVSPVEGSGSVSIVDSDFTKAPLHPAIALKNTMMRALPFVLISLAFFALPLFLSDHNFLWLVLSQVRTYMLGALIWNLIGACLYAQVCKRNQKIMLFIIFALPLITSPYWARFMYMVEMTLRSVFNAPY